MRARRANRILKEISPENTQTLLKRAQQNIATSLKSIVNQLERQSNSTYGDGIGWAKAGHLNFGDTLIECGKQLVALGASFNTGKPPQWYLDQQAAYENRAMDRFNARASRSTEQKRASERC
jgi:hypothetical protein